MGLEEHLIALIAGLFLSAFAILIAWRIHYFTIPHYEEIASAKLPFRSVLGAFTLYLATELLLIPAVVVLGWYVIAQPESIYEVDNAFTLSNKAWINLGSLIVVLIILVLYSFSMRSDQRKLIWNPAQKNRRDLFKDLFVGIFTWFLSFPIVLTIENLLVLIIAYLFPESTTPVDQVAVKYLKALAGVPYLFWLTAFILCTCVPVIEELLFRGFLQTWLKGKLNRSKAIFLTSICFAFMHFSTSQSYANINLLSALFVLSCFLGFLYERQRSLWAPIGLHACFNAISILSF